MSLAGKARKHGISEHTLYQWREHYAGMTKRELAELKAMQEENRRLRSMVASQALDIGVYNELQEGEW